MTMTDDDDSDDDDVDSVNNYKHDDNGRVRSYN